MKNMKSIPPPPLTYRIIEAIVSPIFHRLGLSCRNAYTLSCAKMDRSLTKHETLRLRTHLAICGICRSLPTQFEAMRCLIKASCERDTAHDCSNECLPPESKLRIAQHLQRQRDS